MVSASITVSSLFLFCHSLHLPMCCLSHLVSPLHSHFLCGSHSPFLICCQLLFVGRSLSVYLTRAFFHSLFLLSLSHSISSSPSHPPSSSSLFLLLSLSLSSSPCPHVFLTILFLHFPLCLSDTLHPSLSGACV